MQGPPSLSTGEAAAAAAACGWGCAALPVALAMGFASWEGFLDDDGCCCVVAGFLPTASRLRPSIPPWLSIYLLCLVVSGTPLSRMGCSCLCIASPKATAHHISGNNRDRPGCIVEALRRRRRLTTAIQFPFLLVASAPRAHDARKITAPPQAAKNRVYFSCSSSWCRVEGSALRP